MYRMSEKPLIGADEIRERVAKLAHEMCNCDVEEARRKFDLDKEDNTDDEIGLIANV